MSDPAADRRIDAARRQWDAAADGWDAHSPMLRAWLATPTRTLFEAAAIAEGQCVLDVAAGAGDQTLMLAERIGPQGRVVATDLSRTQIERLRRNARKAGIATIEARVADAQAQLREADFFDAAVCRLGLMLMPEPARCISAVHAALRPGARFSAMVFAGPKENPCIRVLMPTALRHAGLPLGDPFDPGSLFSLGRPGHLQGLFDRAGFREVSTFALEAPFRLATVDDYLAFLRSAAAPVMSVLSALEPAKREAAWQDIREQLAGFAGSDGWTGPNTLLITVGRK
ncbi:MAG: class I SAM-dependent methyltransferase [Flavobacteriaceae bacterium]